MKSLRRMGSACLVLVAARLIAASAAGSVPAWAFPGPGPKSENPPPPDELVSVGGSRLQIKRAQANNPFAPPDWRPELHPARPAVVAYGRAPKLWACALCHLSDGTGRPENASLAGLPAAYIVQQVQAMAVGQRPSAAGDDSLPWKFMRDEARAATPAETAAAAAYFASIPAFSKQTVIETDRPPACRPGRYLYIREPGANTEPIAGRLIEVCTDPEAHERRDPRIGYQVYVPPGSIERGRQLATHGPDGPGTSCFICHGADLRGTPVAPPIAGQFGSYLLRQLLAFSTGARATPLSVLMKPVVAKLSVDDMVALSAYAASR